MRKLALFVVAFIPNAALSQISSGTVIVINFTKDKVVVAADSGVISGVSGKQAENTECKISTFGHRFVFASAGALRHSRLSNADPTEGWDSFDIAREGFKATQTGSSRSADVQLDGMANYWAQEVVNHLVNAYFYFPDQILNFAKKYDGKLGIAFFATASKGTIKSQFVRITFNFNNLASPIEFDKLPRLPSCWKCGQPDNASTCVMGHVHTVENACTTTPAFQSKQIAVDLAELTVAHDRSGEVRDPIDVVELRSDGSPVRRLKCKPKCPTNQDGC
jgi:hypothetical protein